MKKLFAIGVAALLTSGCTQAEDSLEQQALELTEIECAEVNLTSTAAQSLIFLWALNPTGTAEEIEAVAATYEWDGTKCIATVDEAKVTAMLQHQVEFEKGAADGMNALAEMLRNSQ